MVDRTPGFVFELELHLALGGDLQRGLASARELLEPLTHLLCRLDEVLVWHEALRPLEVEVAPMLDAHQNLVRIGIVRARIMAVHRRHALQAMLLPEGEERVIHVVLLGNARILKLEVEVFPESLLEPEQRFFRARLLPHEDLRRQLSLQATRQHDEPVTIAIEQIAINDRPWTYDRSGLQADRSVLVGLRDHLTQVLVARQVLAQKHQMMRLGQVRGL